MPSDVQSTFQKALGLHQRGAIAQAQSLYREVLAQDPRHFDSLHLLGLSHVQGGEIAEGVRHITRALELRRDFPEAHYNLGSALLSLGRPGEALAHLDEALALNPADPQYHLERGNALKDLGRLADALGAYRAAARLAPRLAEAFNNEGVVLKELGRAAEALASYDRAIALEPRYAEAYSNCGNALRELGRYAQALASYDRAIALKPRSAEAYSNRGLALARLRRLDEALASHDQALALRPDYPEALNNRANTLQEMGRPADALASFDRALALRPAYAECWRNRGAVLEDLARFDEALLSYGEAIRLKPDYAEAYNSRSALLYELRRLDEARTDIDKALALEPDKPSFKANKAHLLLIAGDFPHGLPLYEWRRDGMGAAAWTAGTGKGQVDLRGLRLLVRAEQGFGDTIQFSRLVGSLAERGAHVMFAPHRPLCRLMSSLDARFELVEDAAAATGFDREISLLSAMHVLGLTRDSIPARSPYLHAEPERVTAWREALRRRPGEVIVGICWQGGKGAIDRGRSFPLHQFHALSRLPNIRLVSLHKGEGEEQLAGLPPGMRVETLGPGFDAGPGAFLDTAAVITLCDLVITSDTAVAHLAGALGAETWLALKYVPEWRWQLDRRDSPWYPSMTLFRQAANGDWDGVFRDIESHLRDFNPQRREQQ